MLKKPYRNSRGEKTACHSRNVLSDMTFVLLPDFVPVVVVRRRNPDAETGIQVLTIWASSQWRYLVQNLGMLYFEQYKADTQISQRGFVPGNLPENSSFDVGLAEIRARHTFNYRKSVD